jgi:hypothetical protein
MFRGGLLMKHKNIIKKMILAVVIILGVTIIPTKLNQTVKAESNQAAIKEMIQAKIEETQRTKRFGNYNEAYAMIIQLPQAEQTQFLDKLGELASYVYTPLNKEMINSLREFSENANLRDYEAMIVLINKNITDPIDNGYFLGELTSWGKKLVYTPDVVTAVDAVINVYSQKTVQSVDTAKVAITNVKNIDSREYLKEQLIEAAGKVDSVILVYFD